MLYILLFLSCYLKNGQSRRATDPIFNQEKCDSDAYISAEGVGDTPQNAINNSKSQISGEIRSALSSYIKQTSTTHVVSTTHNSEKSSSINFEKQLDYYINEITEFQYADLIEVVVQPTKIGDQYHTLTCLHRVKSTIILSEQLQPVMDRFLKTARLALTHAEEDNYSKFSSQLSVAVRLQKEIRPTLYLIRSISGRPDSSAAEFQATWKRLVSTSADIISASKIGLYAAQSDLSPKTKNTFMELLRIQLSMSGFQVLYTDQCIGGVTHVAEALIQENCIKAAIGYVCEPIIRVTVTECSSNEMTMIVLTDTALSSQGRSEDEALERSLSKAKDANLTSEFLSGLSAIFPLIVE